MKKILLILVLTFFSSVMTFADDITEGYYRVVNLGLEKLENTPTYVRVCDGHIIVSTSAGTAQNFESLQLWPGLEDAIATPSSVLYAKKTSTGWDLQAQGVSVESEIQSNQSLGTLGWKMEGNTSSCILSATRGSTTLYLYSTMGIDMEGGHYKATTSTTNSLDKAKPDMYKKWELIRLDTTSNYAAIKPRFTVEENGVTKYYAPYYASFPFKVLSKGMKVYYVSDLKEDYYTLKQITSDVIPAATPVLVECASSNLADNKIQPLYGDYGTISDNKLSGCYFCNPWTKNSSTRLTTFDPSTVRAWGVENGRLVLTNNTSGYYNSLAKGYYIFANESYATNLPAGTENILYEGEAGKTLRSISVDSASITVSYGKTGTTTVLTSDATSGYGQTVYAVSSNDDVATVTPEATVDANGKAQFTITPTTTDGGSTTITYSTTNFKGETIVASTHVTVPLPEIESITVDSTKINIPYSGAKTITVTALPAYASKGKTVTAASSDNTTAKLNVNSAVFDNDGKAAFTVTGIAPGSAVITFTTGDNNATTTVNVQEPPINNIAVDVTDLQLPYSDKKTIVVTAAPAVAAKGKTITVTSTDESVAMAAKNTATLDANGQATFIIEGKGVGTSVLTFSMDGTTLTASSTVTVPKPAITSVTASETAITLETSKQKTITITALPSVSTSGTTIHAVSSDDSVVQVGSATATLDQNGQATITVTANNPGDATITFTVDGTALTATTTVNVPMPDVSNVYVSEKELTIQLNDNKTVTVTALPALGSEGKTVKVVSSDGTIAVATQSEATLDAEGKATFTIEAKNVGDATITFSVDGIALTAVTTVHVPMPDITSLAVDSTTMTVKADESKTVVVTALPVIAANGKVLHAVSNNAAVATVADATFDANGKATVTVTAKHEGSAVITYSMDGTTLKAFTTVTVPHVQPDTLMLNVNSVEIPYKENVSVTISALPVASFAGKTVKATASVDGIVSLNNTDIVLDDKASAVVKMTATAFGKTVITFAVPGTSLSVDETVTVPSYTVSAPIADIADGTAVYYGQKVTLTNTYANASMYYTTDGTDPKTSATRVKYISPVTISSDIIIKAVAEDVKSVQSDVLALSYTVARNTTGFSLKQGWNWVSFNVTSDKLKTYDAMLACGSWAEGDEVKDKNSFYDYSVTYNKWFGTLSKSNTAVGQIDRMLKIHSNSNQTLDITGVDINPDNCTVSVSSGWNFLPFYSSTALNVNDALENYPAQTNDIIKSQNASAVFNGTDWTGTLTTLQPGQGYMLNSNNSQSVTFSYPVIYPSVSSAKSSVSFDTTSEEDIHLFSGNMNIIASLMGDSIEEGDKVIAIANGEVRGTVEVNADKKVVMTIEGDEVTTVTLLLQRDGNTFATAKETVSFQYDSVIGSWTNPTAVTFVSGDNTDNTESTDIEAVYSIEGKSYGNASMNSLPAGAYIIKTGNGSKKTIKR